MSRSKKIVNNIVALAIKIVLTCIVQLVGTRIALSALGDEGFGLYNLLAGIIVLFSFLTGSLLISTQRYLSIAIGEQDDVKLNSIFNVSLLIHILLAVFVVLILCLLKNLLFSSILNISFQYIVVAKTVYDILLLSITITILSIPFSADINAREDMVFFAFTEIVSLFFKLLAAISLLYIEDNLLLVYTWLMLLAIFVGTILKVVWCLCKYKESKISFALMRNMKLFKEMIGFVSWNTLGSAAVVVRNQGVAVLFNIFFGTVVNAAYGIANQINSLVLSFASTITTVFTPRIVQSKGEKNEKRMLEIAIMSSKLSFLLSSAIALPVLIYLGEILSIWLHNIPPYTETFVFWVVISFLVQQLYPGINRAIYASGKIKFYQVTVAIFLISILPIGYLLLRSGFNVEWVLVLMFVMQILTLLATVYFANKECDLDIKNFYIGSVFKPCLLFIVFYFTIRGCNAILCQNDEPTLLCLSLSSFLYVLVYMSLFLLLILNSQEKNNILSVINKRNKE